MSTRRQLSSKTRSDPSANGDASPDDPSGGDFDQWLDDLLDQAKGFGASPEGLMKALQFRSNGKQPPNEKLSHVLDLSQVTPQRTTWLWRDWIPAGEVTVMEGRKGTGKSTVTSDIAARVISGYDMPDGTPGLRGNVLYLCGEESLAKTLRRRVEQQLQHCESRLGPGQFLVLDTVHTAGGERQYEIPGDLDLIEQAAIDHKAKLLVIDVLDNFLGDKVDTHSNHSVRRALGPLAKVAQKLDLTVIAIRHLRKGQDGLALDQGMGSVGIGAQARSVLRADHHPDKEGRRVLAEVECNVAVGRPISLGYQITSGHDDHGLVAVIDWTGSENLTADDLAGVKPERARELKAAQGWLDDLMNEHDGKVAANEVEGLRQDEEFSLRTLKKAKKKLGIQSKQEYERSEDGKVLRVWYWERAKHDPADDHGLAPK
jgi:hypothetical protein